VSDRFQDPEPPSASDPRRVFIPAPAGGGSGTRAPSPAPPARPRSRPDERAPRGPGGPSGRGPREPGGPPPGRPAPARAPGPRRGLRRPRLRRVALVVAILLVVGILGSFLYARSIFNKIDRVDVSSSLTSAKHGTNYLIVGSDSRANVTKEGDAGFNGSKVDGQRSDTLMVLHLEGGKVKMLSIPRDLYVPIAGTGGSQKINAAYNGGPTRLVDTITQGPLGIPIDRYMEVDFVSFAGLVDALGGVTITIDHPAQDQALGLVLPKAGPVKMDGKTALAYVRSRHYVETIDGRQVQDPTADLGRIQRQQQFLAVVFAKLAKTKNPFTLAHAANGMAGGLRIDDKMSLFDALRLGWGMRGIAPESLKPLPVDNDRNASGAVLILREQEAQPILDQVR
jgi:LCP family protein required for cell wall assembly